MPLASSSARWVEVVRVLLQPCAVALGEGQWSGLLPSAFHPGRRARAAGPLQQRRQGRGLDLEGGILSDQGDLCLEYVGARESEHLVLTVDLSDLKDPVITEAPRQESVPEVVDRRHWPMGALALAQDPGR